MSTKDFDEIDFDDMPADGDVNEDIDEYDETGSYDEDEDFEDDVESGEDAYDENEELSDEYDDFEEDILEEDLTDEDFDESDLDEEDLDEEEMALAESDEVIKKYDPDDYTEEDFNSVGEGSDPGPDPEEESGEKKKSGKAFKLVLGIGLGFLALVILFAVWILFTKSGSDFIGGVLAKFGLSSAGKSIGDEETEFILNNFGISLEGEQLSSLLAKKGKDRDKGILLLVFDKYGVNADEKEIESVIDKLEGSLDVDKIKQILRDHGVDIDAEDRIREILETYEIVISEDELKTILAKDARSRDKDILKLILEGYAVEMDDAEIDAALGENGGNLNLDAVKRILAQYGIKSPDEITPTPVQNDTTATVRSEDYVKTYLIFGIESVRVGENGEVYYDNSSIGNTDAILLVSVNSKDKTIKMTSIMRDTFVEIPGYFANKINAAYSLGAKGSKSAAEAHEKGADMLIKVIENTFRIKISGWACVNFNSFEKIVDRLGGIDIELGEAEARYLNRTNYIKNAYNRNLSAGWNHMNGDQVRGYCRVRKEKTLGGYNNDYGRTVRHQRVINAIIKKYTSSGIMELIPIMSDILGYVFTNLSEDELTEVLSMVIDNRIFTTQSLRLPIDGTFYDSGTEGIDNGSGRKITWTLVIGNKKQGIVGGEPLEENIKKLYQFVFLDEEETDEEASDSETE
ncbi:MAG: LCP family protein [Lachnospiraceae bacterium]|nr:LCP family protein [Lachnospiraceae bacterium]